MRFTAPDHEFLEAPARRYESDGKYAQAAMLYAHAAISLEGEDPARAADLWRHAGVCAHKVYDNEEAANRFRRAIILLPADQPARTATVAHLYANLCYVYYLDSRLQLAYAAGREALRHAGATGNLRLCAAAALNLGLVARYLDRRHEALTLFEDARRWHLQAAAEVSDEDERDKLSSRAADALHNMGWVLLDLGQHDAAERAILAAHSEKRKLGKATGRIWVELARLQLLRGRAAEALGEVAHVLDSGDAQVDPETHLQALIIAAEAAGAGDPAVGLRYAQAGVELALTLGRPPLLFDLLATTRRLRASVGEPTPPSESTLFAELLARKTQQEPTGEGWTGEEHQSLVDCRDGPGPDPGLIGESRVRERGPAGGQTGLELGQPGAARRDQVGSQVGGRQGARVARRQGARRSVRGGYRVDVAPSGERLRQLRLDLGLTQRDVAEVAGCEPTTVWRAEHGKGPERTVRALIAVLHQTQAAVRGAV